MLSCKQWEERAPAAQGWRFSHCPAGGVTEDSFKSCQLHGGRKSPFSKDHVLEAFRLAEDSKLLDWRLRLGVMLLETS